MNEASWASLVNRPHHAWFAKSGGGGAHFGVQSKLPVLNEVPVLSPIRQLLIGKQDSLGRGYRTERQISSVPGWSQVEHSDLSSRSENRLRLDKPTRLHQATQIDEGRQ